MNFSDIENETKNFYEKLWSDPSKIRRSGRDIFLGWHYGFYEKGIKKMNEAMINMNEYVRKLLELDDKIVMNILDAGSGIGSTSIYLAMRFPNCIFYGITLTSNELKIAESLQTEKSINNVRFKQGSYMNSGYPDNFFDRILAIESLIYSSNKKKFLKEIYRILKPNGKLIIIDTFTQNHKLSTLTINIDNYLHQRKYSEKELTNYYMDIGLFILSFKPERFKEVKVQNLVESRNVKKSHIYGFLIYRSFISLSSQLKKIREAKKMILLKFLFTYPFAFSTLFIYRLLLIFITKPRYYSITTFKK